MDFAIRLEQEEPRLIAACVRQERWAQQRLYEENYGLMMGVCLRYARTKDEALDLLHEGFLKVFGKIAKYQPGTSLQAWMRTIMVNTCIDYYRKAIRRRTEDIEEANGFYTQDPDPISELTRDEILEAVQQLTDAYRTVFNLYAIEGYSHKEIADALDITESTSRSNLVKARSKLREYFAEKRIFIDPNSFE